LGAPAELVELEEQLLQKAQLVFTGGMALYEAKRSKHANIHPAPSSVDAAFFRQARQPLTEPADQAPLPHPIAGYCGVIDERLDLELLAHLAARLPHVSFVMLGPVVKIDEDSLPRRPNIHYLGAKPYAELPSYLAHWDVALMPFAMNEATRFISPTKTPEYLAAGRAVVSTPIRDVVEPYGRMGLVRIGADHAQFANHVEALLNAEDTIDRSACDAFLARMSWSSTWAFMESLLREAQRAEQQPTQAVQAPALQGGLHV
jgi:UDP-galactopyranose mutase